MDPTPKDNPADKTAFSRRDLMARAAGGAVAAAALGAPALAGAGEDKPRASKGRIKQSVSRWCFGKWSLEELCQKAVQIGLKGIDLVGADVWPTVK